MSTLPPIYVFALIPTPPVTIRVPVVTLVDSVFFNIYKFPEITPFPPIYVFALIPTPPVTTSVPFVIALDSIPPSITVLPPT